MPILKAPKEFTDKLRRFDPELRCRWAHRTKLWMIEKRMPLNHPQLVREKPNPWRSARGLDIYDGWQQGYIHILSVHPTMLDDRVFEVLREADTWRAGGIAKFNKQMDEAIATERKAEDRAIQNWNESASREAHDMIQWGLGNRFAMTAPTPVARDTGFGFLVRDSRRHASTDWDLLGAMFWMRDALKHLEGAARGAPQDAF